MDGPRPCGARTVRSGAGGPVDRSACSSRRQCRVAGMEGPPIAAPEPELSAGLHGRATPEPGLTYHVLRALWRLAAGALGLRLRLEGAEHLPRDAAGRPTGGGAPAGMPHRPRIGPFAPRHPPPRPP